MLALIRYYQAKSEEQSNTSTIINRLQADYQSESQHMRSTSLSYLSFFHFPPSFSLPLSLSPRPSPSFLIYYSALRDVIGSLRSQIAAAYDHMRTCPYVLYAVWVHQGVAGSGHYWAFLTGMFADRMERSG